jgi:hypothetical protein
LIQPRFGKLNAMIHSQIDHLAVTAPSLEAGVDYVRRALGVPLQVGGEHPRMGTHNYVLKLGEKVYLEVISINPAASAPDRPRWFDLDAPDPFRVPRLATWIVRTNDIQEAVSRSPIVSGHIEPMSRGDLNWKITIPKDGSLPLGGVVPTLIQWQDVHPAEALQDFGCRLLRLEGFHPEAERVNEGLATIGFQGEFSVTPLAPGARPYLVAHIQTPTGERKISSS